MEKITGQTNWKQMANALGTNPPKGRVPGLDLATKNAWGNGLRGLSDRQIDQTMKKTFTWYRNHANRYGFVDSKNRDNDPHDRFRQKVGDLYEMYQQYRPDGIDSKEAQNLCHQTGAFHGGADKALRSMLVYGNYMLDNGLAKLPD